MVSQIKRLQSYKKKKSHFSIFFQIASFLFSAILESPNGQEFKTINCSNRKNSEGKLKRRSYKRTRLPLSGNPPAPKIISLIKPNFQYPKERHHIKSDYSISNTLTLFQFTNSFPVFNNNRSQENIQNRSHNELV